VDKLCRNVNDHIVTVYCHDKLPNSPYYFIDMELCDMNLEEYTYREQSPDGKLLQFQRPLHLGLDVGMIWNIMRDIADGVAFIHNHVTGRSASQPFLRLRKLRLYLGFYLDNYLASMQHPESMEVLRATESLQQVLREIIVCASQMDEPRKLLSIVLDSSRIWPWDNPQIRMAEQFAGIRKFNVAHWESASALVFAKVLLEVITGQSQPLTEGDAITIASPPVLLCRYWALRMSRSEDVSAKVQALFWAAIALRRDVDQASKVPLLFF